MFSVCVYKSVLAEHIYLNGHRTFVSCGNWAALVT